MTLAIIQKRCKAAIREHNEVTSTLLVTQQLTSLSVVCEAIADVMRNSGTLYIVGNGGSAADAQHIAAEFVNKFAIDRCALPALALTTDTSVLTAIANDSNFKYVFSRQLEAFGKKRDALLVLTTSDSDDMHSENLAVALLTAKRIGMQTFGLISRRTTHLRALLDHHVAVPSAATPRVQEAHILLAHIICENVEILCKTEQK